MTRSTNDWTGLTVSQGRYQVRAKLGEGGMGYVYRALDRNLDAEVVIKAPRAAMIDDPEFSSRFAREIRSLVKLAHPHVVRLTDVGEHDGAPFAVMQYLSGGSLDDYRANARGGPAAAATPAAGLGSLSDWLPGVAAALDFVHSQGYVHRDVKPGNILFDAHGHVFLSDFGIAKALASAPEAPRGRTAATGAGLVLGTPEYMAPELVMGEPFDGRIDQYALAVTVYETLAGRRPYEAGSPTAILVMQTTHEPTPLCEVEPRVPRALSDAVARALSKDPARRFPTCGAFAREVVASASQAADAGRPPSRPAPRPDQARLECPRCAKFLVFPASLLADPQRLRGKRVTCPACDARLRVSDDGRSLRPAGAGPTTGFESPAAGGTRKFVAPRPEPAPAAGPARTPVRTVAVGAPATPPESPVELIRVGANRPPHRRLLVWGVAASAAAALLVASVGIAAYLIAPRTGRIKVDVSSAPRGASFILDGAPVDPARFETPLALSPGEHELAVLEPGYQPFRRSITVTSGEVSGFKVFLSPLAPPTAKVEAAARDEPARPAKEPRTLDEPPPRPTAALVRPPAAPERILQGTRSPAPRWNAPAFEPVPDGPVADQESLASLLDHPAALANRVVVPKGLYVVGRYARPAPDGTVKVSLAPAGLHVRGQNLAALQQSGPGVSLTIDPDLARHLSALGAVVLTSPGRTGDDAWGDNSAVLTVHVQHRTDEPGKPWVPVLKKVEFLIGMNFLRIGEGKFGGSFRTVTVTPADGRVVGVSTRHDWAPRLGQPYIGHLKRLVHGMKNEQFARDMQQMDGAMSKMLGNLMRNNSDPTRALDAQFRGRVMGR